MAFKLASHYTHHVRNQRVPYGHRVPYSLRCPGCISSSRDQPRKETSKSRVCTGRWSRPRTFGMGAREELGLFSWASLARLEGGDAWLCDAVRRWYTQALSDTSGTAVIFDSPISITFCLICYCTLLILLILDMLGMRRLRKKRRKAGKEMDERC